MPVLALPQVLEVLAPAAALPRPVMEQKQGNPLSHCSWETEGKIGWGNTDPAGAHEDDSHHRQKFACQEILSSVNRRRQQAGR